MKHKVVGREKMSRKNYQGSIPQRTRLISDRELRSRRSEKAFSMFRPVQDESAAKIHERLNNLQHELDIPESVKLYNHDLHSSIIQERRMRRSLATHFAAGVAVGTILSHMEGGLPGNGKGVVSATFKQIDVIGRNRNIIIAHIEDEKGILRAQTESLTAILGSFGLHLNVDKHAHLTLGTSAAGLSATERRHVIHTVEEVVQGIPIELGPVEIEQNGHRVPLANAKILGN
jgi:hypothetical protein